MLGVNQLDFINYCNALKGNYRKGVHKMETLLENPTHAKEFAKNLGGVSVVLGTPVGKEDRNSETLRSMLLASDVANDAVYTWMGQYYEFDSWDELLGDEDRCKAMMAFQSTLPRRERQHLLTSFRLQYGYSLFHLTNKI